MTKYPKRPSLVVIDLDGTITEDQASCHTIQAAFRRVGVDICGVVAKARETIYQKGFLGVHFSEKAAKNCPIMKRMANIRPDALLFLQSLKEKNIPVILYSNGPGKGYGRDVLEKLGISEYFSDVFFREDMDAPKPRTLSLRRTIAEKYDDCQKIWFVGNETGDWEAVESLKRHLPDKQVDGYIFDDCPAFKNRFNFSGFRISNFQPLCSMLIQTAKNTLVQKMVREKTAPPRLPAV